MRTINILFLLGVCFLLNETAVESMPIRKTDSFKKVDSLVVKLRNDLRNELRGVNKEHSTMNRQHSSYVKYEKNYKTLKERYDRLYRHYYHLLKSTTNKKANVDTLRKELLAEIKLVENVRHMLHSYVNYADRLKRHYANCNCSAT